MSLYKKVKLYFQNRHNKRFNDILVPKNNKLEIQIFGKNNTLHIDKGSIPFRGKITIYGDNNKIHISKSKYRSNMNIRLGLDSKRTMNNCLFEVGEDLYCGSTNILLAEDDFIFKIGSDCMFSEPITILGSDTHTLTDLKGNFINQAQSIIIGNHVWIGQNVHVLKNTTIPDNCIIGLGSIVVGKKFKPNSVIAGNPAKVVKEGVNWNRDFPSFYKKNQKNNPS